MQSRVDKWTSKEFDYLYLAHCHYGIVVIMGHTWARSYNGLESYWTAQMKLLGLIPIGRNGL